MGIPGFKYLISNNDFVALTHIASPRVREEGHGAGKHHKIRFVALCTGKQLGGSYGQAAIDSVVMGTALCDRCIARYRRALKNLEEP